ncbi:MAG: acetoacetate decarboxylase family protein [Actinomycetota bacterium]|nr:acetoacetate decarboxylase family protein [Actinomycetota bacterium]
MTTTTTWGEIQGQTITFPMEVTRFDTATFLFTVPLDAAQALVPGDAFEVVAIGPDVAQLVIAFCDYIENPWGDYLELNFGFLARPVGAADDVIGSFVYRMPVDQAFTCEAGNKVMGFPKTVEQMARHDADGRCTVTLHEDGAPSVVLRFPTPAGAGDPPAIESLSYSYLDGVAYETPLTMDMGTGMIDPADVEISLGDGPIAVGLRSLGLPAVPDLATWGTDLSATFQLGRPVDPA